MISKVKVKILNQDYVLKCNLDSDYIENLAAILNKRLNDLQKASSTRIEDKHALILVALNLLDELEMSREASTTTSEDEVVRKTNRLISMLEKGIVGDIV